MEAKMFYRRALVPSNCKEKKGYFFVEELFEGDFEKKAPITLRGKIDREAMEMIETSIKGCYCLPSDSRMVFESYYDFRDVLKENEINIKLYYKS